MMGVYHANTECHIADLGGVALHFVPEANGALFLTNFSKFRRGVTPVNNGGENVADLETWIRATGGFLRHLVLPGDVKTFDELGLPVRILSELLDWVVELYGSGSAGRPVWTVWRILTSLETTWGPWFGDLTLAGVDPRQWDLDQLLSAYEAALRSSSKDETDWNRTRNQLYAPPRPALGRKPSAPASDARGHGMDLAAAETLMARMAAADVLYG